MSSLTGKTICFTGTLSQKRSDAEAAARIAGATVKSGVTAALNILVAGPGSGSKLAEAEKKGVAVWTEADFDAAISGGGGASSSSVAAVPAPASGEGGAEGAAAQVEPARKRAKSSHAGEEELGVLSEGEHRTLDVAFAISAAQGDARGPLAFIGQLSAAGAAAIARFISRRQAAAMSGAGASAAGAIVTRVVAHGEVCDLRRALCEVSNPGQHLVPELDRDRLSLAHYAAAEASREQCQEACDFYDDEGCRLANASALKHAAALCVLLQSPVLADTDTTDLGFSQSYTQGDSSYLYHLDDPQVVQEVAKAVLAAPALRTFSGIPMAGLRDGTLAHLRIIASGSTGEVSAFDPQSGRATLHLTAHDGHARTDLEGVTLLVLAPLLKDCTSLVSIGVEVQSDVYAAVALQALAGALTGSLRLQSLSVSNPYSLEPADSMVVGDTLEPSEALAWLAGLVHGTPSLTRLALSPAEVEWSEEERPLLVAALHAVEGAALSFTTPTGETVGEDDEWTDLVVCVAGRPHLELLAGGTHTLSAKLEHEDVDVRRQAVEAIGENEAILSAHSVAVVACLDDEDSSVSQAAMAALGNHPSVLAKHVAAVVGWLGDSEERVREAAAAALEVLNAHALLSPEVLDAHAAALTQFEVLRVQDEAVDRPHAVIAKLADARPWVRAAAVQALVSNPFALPSNAHAIVQLLDHADAGVQEAALDVLSKLAPGHSSLAWHGEAVVERVRAH